MKKYKCSINILLLFRLIGVATEGVIQGGPRPTQNFSVPFQKYPYVHFMFQSRDQSLCLGFMFVNKAAIKRYRIKMFLKIIFKIIFNPSIQKSEEDHSQILQTLILIFSQNIDEFEEQVQTLESVHPEYQIQRYSTYFDYKSESCINVRSKLYVGLFLPELVLKKCIEETAKF